MNKGIRLKNLTGNGNGFIHVFLVLYALFGFYTLYDYGVPLDELTQRHIGLENARYIYGTGKAESVAAHGFFGPVLEVVDYAAEQVIYQRPLGDKLVLRHVLLFVVFLLAIKAFYRVAKYLAKVPNAAGVATVLFALTPWLFAHAHYNSKDTFFLCLVVFVLYFIVRFAQLGSILQLIIAAGIAGVAATVRLNGLFVIAAIVVALLFSGKSDFRIRAKRIFIALVIFIISFVLFYPYLWIVKWNGFEALWHYVTQNPWPWDTLAAGQNMVAGHLPWWYLSAWMGVTIPVLGITLFLWGIFENIRIKKHHLGLIEWILFGLLFFPLLYFAFMRPTLYNGWRHMQFLYAPISLFVVFSLNRILTWKWAAYTPWILGAYSAFTFMLWQPYGYAYFNEIYAAAAKPCTWDQDYWGLSANQGLRWVAAHDQRDSIVISSFTESPELNAILLPEKDQKRFHFIHTPGAGDYEIEVKRGRYFADLNGTMEYSVCPLKDTLVRVVKLKH